MVGIALALPAGLWILQVNMDEMSAQWEGRPGLSVYFTLQADNASVAAVQGYLEDQQNIDRVELTTAKDALEEFKTYSGLGSALDLLGSNPLPASLQARFAQSIGPIEVELLINETQAFAGVAEVVVEKTWLERLNELSRVVSRLGAMLAVLFGLGAVLVTASSVRLAIEARLDELRVLKLVGATPGQVRRPFLYFGAIYGFGGGVVAAMLIAITILVIEPPLQGLLGSYQQTLDLAGFGPLFLTALLLVGSGLGILGALMAVRQRVRDLEVV